MPLKSLKIGILVPFLQLITLALAAQSNVLNIWEIQGESNQSPYLNQIVTTTANIVTAVGSDCFFIQSPAGKSDNNPLTSEGIKVYTGFRPDLTAGVSVVVSGMIQEYKNMTQIGPNALSIKIEPGQMDMPEPIVLNSEFPSDVPAEVPDLEAVEGMLLSFEAITTGPININDRIPLSARMTQSYREPGIRFPGISELPVWDGNPEIFWIAPGALGLEADPYTGAKVKIQASGVLNAEDDKYVVWPLSLSMAGEPVFEPVSARGANQLTLGSLNAVLLREENFFLNSNLIKTARYIIEGMGSPDILALQEIGTSNILSRLAQTLRSMDPSLDYQVVFRQGNGDIHLGFLISRSLKIADVQQLGTSERLDTGLPLHDRPPLLVELELPTEPVTRLMVMNVHLRSFFNIDDPEDGERVRNKRQEQAISIAEMVQQYHGSNLIVAGDFNAYAFSDGYVDVLGQITGQPGLDALLGNIPIVYPPLTNISASLPDSQQYSYSYEGNAELLDHCLSNDLPDFKVIDLQYARGNAENAFDHLKDSETPYRSSDHDGFVLFLEPLRSVISSTTTVNAEGTSVFFPNPYRENDEIRIFFERSGNNSLQLYNAAGQLTFHCQLKGKQENLRLPKLPGGIYFMRISGPGQFMTKKIMLANP